MSFDCTLEVYSAMTWLVETHSVEHCIPCPTTEDYFLAMVDLFPVLSAFSTVLIIGTARAQVSAPNCSNSSMAWSLNSLGQGPCLVVAYLLSTCSNGAFSVSSLLPQHSYSGPIDQDNSHPCRCNTVAYNLFSACDVCQGEPWILYSAWSTNCTSPVTAGIFPKPIPVGTRVPRWAFLDPTPDDNWNLTSAQLVGDAPEVTGTVTVTPTPTTSSVSSNSPTKSSSNSGAIAGGVVGGITVALLISGIVSWFAIRRRRRRRRARRAALSTSGQMTVPHSLALTETPTLYDPSNPSTYPTQLPPLIIHKMNDSKQSSDFESYPRPNRQGYSGRPEV